MKKDLFSFDENKFAEGKNNDFPWLAAIIASTQGGRFKSLLCVGTLINDRDILTSATCVHLFKPEELFVSFTSNSYNSTSLDPTPSVQVAVESIKVHPSFVKRFSISGRVLKNDIAVVRLAQPIDLENGNNGISPICLHEESNPSSAKQLKLTGWSYAAPSATSTIQGVNSNSVAFIDVIPAEECKEFFSRIIQLDTHTTICTSTPKSICFLERGSPLLFEYSGFTYQSALVSLSRQIADCSLNRNKVPTVLVKIHPYFDWIKDVTSDAHWCWAPYQAFS